jgi:hypothetical protein
MMRFKPKARMLLQGNVNPIAAIDVTRQKREIGVLPTGATLSYPARCSRSGVRDTDAGQASNFLNQDSTPAGN